MATSIASSTLGPSGLTEDQRLHFAEHGWVVVEAVLNQDQCDHYIDSVDYTLGKLAASGGSYAKYTLGTRRGFMEPHLRDARFADIYETPGLLEAAGQLIGSPDVRYSNSIVVATTPAPGRESDRDALTDPSTLTWHRDHRPRWNILEDEHDPRFVNSSVISVVAFFTPMSQEDGATALLDGSHRMDGPWNNTPDVWAALRDRCPVVYPAAPAGSIVLFSESLVHSATMVLSERTRYAHFSWLHATWMAHDGGKPPHLIERYASERIKQFFSGPEAGAFFQDAPGTTTQAPETNGNS
jgi:hypothetical protein